MSDPCVLIASCSQIKPKDLVKLVLGATELPQSDKVVEDIFAYKWHIENKYYTAEVRLCTTETRTIGNTAFADSVQAFVVHFDSKELSSFERVQAWMPYVKELDPDIRMLICDTSSSTDAVDRLTAQKFCIQHSFELVELSPEGTNSDSEEEDDFKETTGIKRVVQALHAHTWPNLVMKDRPDVRSAYFKQLMQEEFSSKSNSTADNSSPSEEDFQDFVSCEPVRHSQATDSHNTNTYTEERSFTCVSSIGEGKTPVHVCSGSTELNEDSVTSSATGNDLLVGSDFLRDGQKKNDFEKDRKACEGPSSEQIIDSLVDNDDMTFLAALGNEDPGKESFEQLFEKLRIMKEKAEGLPPEQRKAYAEKVAVSFWKAIGGDEDEIDGLVDSD
ncbi:alpha- and gamma-adaptin-binding protein p34-like [Liolophura sinensis]|uniref:alpha- and gamma-adaptin-binding protein p34-like n=1 Tax=Liolophura sinensis TaxID=3198878 RepID=UPI0031596456